MNKLVPRHDPKEPPFQIGDIVQLNSGGKAMMIVDVLETGTVIVGFRDEKGKIVEVQILASCIHRAKDLW